MEADHSTLSGRLHFFKEQIGIDATALRILDPFRPIFVEAKDQFADAFHNAFHSIAETRPLLEGVREAGAMKRLWASWFEAFFSSEFDESFLLYLWKIGARHVEVNLDQRFSNLGFALIRQFCHDIVLSKLSVEEQGRVTVIIDKLVDLCLLIETTAYIEKTISCDIEVMREMADRIRNPAMIIGWNIKKMRDRVSAESKEYKVYGMLMSENQRLEGMVRDIKVYMDMFQSDPHFQKVPLRDLIEEVIAQLGKEGPYGHIQTEIAMEPAASSAIGDPQGLRYLFYYLLQNSMEAAATHGAQVKITSVVREDDPQRVQVSIFNTGEPPGEKAETLFTPFFSTKLHGTGFGLPIAQIIVRKHHGRLVVQPAPDSGTNVILDLPRSD